MGKEKKQYCECQKSVIVILSRHSVGFFCVLKALKSNRLINIPGSLMMFQKNKDDDHGTTWKKKIGLWFKAATV